MADFLGGMIDQLALDVVHDEVPVSEIDGPGARRASTKANGAAARATSRSKPAASASRGRAASKPKPAAASRSASRAKRS
jgi:hypothetical protein